MKVSNEMLTKIRTKEALRTRPYMPTANDRPTIGYGSTFYENGTPVKMSDPAITKERAEQLFAWWIDNKCEQPLRKLVTVPVTQNQWDALVSLVYNIGTGNFADSSVREYLNAKNYAKAADAFLSWNKQRTPKGLVIVPGLVTRRKEERALFLK